jgi:transposase
MHPETLRKKVRQPQPDSGARPDLPSSAEREEIRKLRQENFELRAERMRSSGPPRCVAKELDEDRMR